MINVRLTGSKEELEIFIGALGRLECIKDSSFSPPRKGGNPKYAGDSNVLSYGTLSIDTDVAVMESVKGKKIRKLKGIADKAK